jgi:hypothetical protein
VVATSDTLLPSGGAAHRGLTLYTSASALSVASLVAAAETLVPGAGSLLAQTSAGVSVPLFDGGLTGVALFVSLPVRHFVVAWAAVSDPCRAAR